MDKAQILYNHIWHSTLDEQYIDQLYHDKRYLKIIKHKNYNPRIIEFITDSERLSGVLAENYWDNIFNILENPTIIWSNTYDNQSNDYVRALVLLVVFSNGKIDESLLSRAYSLSSLRIRKTEPQNTDFNSSIKIAGNYFLNRSINKEVDTIVYSLFNPSITDFILGRYCSSYETIDTTLSDLKSAESVKFVSQAAKNDKLNRNVVIDILVKLFNELKDDAKYASALHLMYQIRLKT